MRPPWRPHNVRFRTVSESQAARLYLGLKFKDDLAGAVRALMWDADPKDLRTGGKAEVTLAIFNIENSSAVSTPRRRVGGCANSLSEYAGSYAVPRRVWKLREHAGKQQAVTVGGMQGRRAGAICLTAGSGDCCRIGFGLWKCPCAGPVKQGHQQTVNSNIQLIRRRAKAVRRFARFVLREQDGVSIGAQVLNHSRYAMQRKVRSGQDVTATCIVFVYGGVVVSIRELEPDGNPIRGDSCIPFVRDDK